MRQKVLIATLAVVVAVVVALTVLDGRVERPSRSASQAVEERIPPEQEIARLRMELDKRTRENDKDFDRVARQAVAVEKLEAKGSRAKKDLAEGEARIRAMRSSLAGDARIVRFKGQNYSRADLLAEYKLAGARFLADEARLHRMEQRLAAQRQLYKRNRKKLSELEESRRKLLAELQRLETALGRTVTSGGESPEAAGRQERQAQAQEANTLDDAGFLKIRKDMDNLRDKISVMKKKRELMDEIRGPDRATKERRERDGKLLEELEKRFGDKGKKQ
jgi:hypothetical protein